MFRVYTGDWERESVDREKLTEEEKSALADKLKRRQKEMKDFTGFLKNKFLS